MNRKQFGKFLKENPGSVRPGMFRRPDWTRRNFFKVMGAGVAGSCFVKEATAQTFTGCTSQQVTTKNTAKNMIFILMAGAPSHMDTFDFKMTERRDAHRRRTRQTVNGILWPTGIFPKLAARCSAISRSCAPCRRTRWCIRLGQTWVQIGRNPAAALGNIAPNIGSIVALEKAAERKPSDVLPTFLALNSDGAVGSGYLDASYAPFKYDPIDGGTSGHARILTGRRAGRRCSNTLHTEDGAAAEQFAAGQAADDMNNFYQSAQSMMYNPPVKSVFNYSAADSTRYGSSSFGNSLMIAKQALASNMGIAVRAGDGRRMGHARQHLRS